MVGEIRKKKLPPMPGKKTKVLKQQKTKVQSRKNGNLSSKEDS